MKHVVGFSGGIDSQACARWVLERYPVADVELFNSTAGGWEDPFTTDFVAWYSANIHHVHVIDALVSDMWETPGFAETKGRVGSQVLTFEDMCIIKGRAPSRRAQFCTEKLKIKPQKRWLLENVTEEYERYTGRRRDESQSRKETPLREWDEYFDCYVNNPLAEWTKQQCFDYVQSFGEEINPLYALGFNRVGCAPCINSGKEDIMNWERRRPEMIDKVRGFEKRTGRTFFAPMVPGLKINTIDEVLQWARTSRGGRQQMFPILHEREACESKYGLCE